MDAVAKWNKTERTAGTTEETASLACEDGNSIVHEPVLQAAKAAKRQFSEKVSISFAPFLCSLTSLDSTLTQVRDS